MITLNDMNGDYISTNCTNIAIPMILPIFSYLDPFAKMEQIPRFVNQLPSGYVKIACENGHRNSEFSHSKL